MSVPCGGACGLYVDEPGQVCISCLPFDPNRPEPDPTLRLRHRILDAAFRLAFGTKAEQDKALEDIAHLTVVLQTENQTPKKEETEC